MVFKMVILVSLCHIFAARMMLLSVLLCASGGRLGKRRKVYYYYLSLVFPRPFIYLLSFAVVRFSRLHALGCTVLDISPLPSVSYTMHFTLGRLFRC
ncbi:hypothetical protein B0H67DRAFT_79011 [Lasiosphaeris hirsuta]|uniref:Uncharacterized protein n=1 Tax=Lasiosphaeris hirsuta TaxID=260670 RepID=A0AA40EBS5_9PEZI|nr:hypothetical protein B0H67DRAFT_79011 [Lasiosphaeris hirsuta]